MPQTDRSSGILRRKARWGGRAVLGFRHGAATSTGRVRRATAGADIYPGHAVGPGCMHASGHLDGGGRGTAEAVPERGERAGTEIRAVERLTCGDDYHVARGRGLLQFKADRSIPGGQPDRLSAVGQVQHPGAGTSSKTSPLMPVGSRRRMAFILSTLVCGDAVLAAGAASHLPAGSPVS